jgi:hypothetical protein
MAKEISSIAQNQITNKDIKTEFTLTIGGIDYSAYLVSWSISNNTEFGSASSTFILINDGGMFGDNGENQINIGDIVSFSEKFGGDTNNYNKFYGFVNQRSIVKNDTTRQITLVCLDYISRLQFLDIDLKCEGTKVEVTGETLIPNYLSSPNESLAQLFNFANDSLADNPRPTIVIRNKNTDADDPAYDGYTIYYDDGQLKLGYPINALDNYDIVCTSYYFYTEGLYIEDILEDILCEPDGYGKYLFDENTETDFINNHLIDTFLNVEGTTTDYLVPNSTSSTITIKTTLTLAVSTGATSINVTSTEGFSNSGEGSINGDIFTWTGKTSTTLTGIPSSGEYSLSTKSLGSYVEYENSYSAGKVWYLTYSNVQSDLTSSDFTIPGANFVYFDKRYGRIIIDTSISIGSTVTCNSDYSFKTLQATGIQLNKISFDSRSFDNRFEAVKKLFDYLAPNYVIRTQGDNKIWANYLSQKTNADYTLELTSELNYVEDSDLYTRILFYTNNKNPDNLMFNEGVDFITTGESYTAYASNSELTQLRESGNYYVYGLGLGTVGKITTNNIKPIIYINGVPIDNTTHIVAGQSVTIETTTTTETTTSGGK